MKITGFWESRAPDRPPEVRTTLGPIEVDDLVVRLGDRLHECPPGAVVRIDLIVWPDDAS